jgi:formiminotetrahydrofolate cyclodeaminase
MPVEKFADKTCKDFCREVSAKDGKPGGGSVAALTGACAASLGVMVANLTEGKKRYQEHEAEVMDARDKLETLRTYLLYLVDEDIKGFAPLQKYSAMDTSDPLIASKYQGALRTACFIPNEIHYKMVEVAELLATIAEFGCVGAISDIGAALVLCRAVMETCRFTTLSNAKYMKDEVYAATLAREFEISFGEIMPKIDAALAMVEEKLSR